MDTRAKHPHTARAVVLAVVAIAFAVMYLGGFLVFLSDSTGDRSELELGNPPDNSLLIHVTVSSIDALKQEADLSFQPEPTGSLTADRGFTAKKDFTYYITTPDNAKTVTFKAGEPMIATRVTVPIDGEISVYPFDSYNVTFDLASDLPMVIDNESHFQAYHALMTLDKARSHEGDLVVDYRFSRSNSIVLFALFVYVLQALVAAVAVIVTICVVWGGYELNFGHLTWGAALLFVLPGVRSGLPGQPPIGTIFDFLVFFWSEVILVACTVTLVFTWVKRSKPSGS